MAEEQRDWSFKSVVLDVLTLLLVASLFFKWVNWYWKRSRRETTKKKRNKSLPHQTRQRWPPPWVKNSSSLSCLL